MSEAGGPKKVGNVLGAILAKYGYANATAQLELEQAWRSVVGEPANKRSRVGSLRRGTLEILVDNSTLLQELEAFRKDELLEAMQQVVRHSKIESLRFRRK
ncbi:MAG: DUF721 domain-containing protein [Planctomycetota bacterium]